MAVATVAAIDDKKTLSLSPSDDERSPSTDVTQHSKTPKTDPDDDYDNLLLRSQNKKSLKKPHKHIRHHRRKRPCCFVLYLFCLCGYITFGAAIFNYLEHKQSETMAERRLHACSELRETITEKMEANMNEITMMELNGTSFLTEILTLKKSFNESLIQMETCLSDLNSRGSIKFNFTSAAFYSISVLTTVGYGDIVAETTEGRITTIFYAIIGIPLYIAFVSDLGDILGSRIVWIGKQLKNCCLRIRKRHPLSLEERSKNPHTYFRFALVALFLIVLILLTSIMIQLLENWWGRDWTYLEALHFVFSTVTLVGFGDIVATHMAVIFVYLPFLIVGQTLVALCFYFSQRIIRYDVPHLITRCCMRSAEKQKPKSETPSSDSTSTGPGFHGQSILSIKMHPPSDSSDESNQDPREPGFSLGKFMPCVPGEPEEKSSTMTVFARTPYHPSFSLITTPASIETFPTNSKND